MRMRNFVIDTKIFEFVIVSSIGGTLATVVAQAQLHG